MKSWRVWLLFSGAALLLITLAYQSARPMHIAVGARQAEPFLEGFSFRERAGFGDFRWSGAEATLSFRGIGNQSGTLRMRIGAPGGHVVLRVNGREIASGIISGPEVREYSFSIDRAGLGTAGDLAVNLVGDTFTAPPDPRELGLQVVSASFEPSGDLVFPAPMAVLYAFLDLILVLAIVRAWSGSAKLAWGFSTAAMLAIVWGLTSYRLETVWLLRVTFWFGLCICLLAWMVVLLLKQFYPVGTRTLRVLGLIALLALAVRIPLATTPGLIVDIQGYVVWSYKLTRYGLGSTYQITEGLWVPDYPPFLLYLFQALGMVYQKLFAPDFLYPVTAGDPALRAVTTQAALLADPIHRTLLRIPAITADLITGALIFVLARNRLSERKSLLVAACYWFNPAVVYNSALWGQTDAVHTLLVMLAFALVEVRRVGWGFFAVAIAGLTKPQALVFGPLLLLRAFQRQKWRGVGRAAIGGIAGFALAVAPMLAAGALPGLLSHLGGAIGYFPVLSANAHNLWWFVTFGQTGVEDTATLFGGLSYRGVGLILLAGAYGFTLANMLKRPRREVWPAAAYIGFAFFLLSTEMHENHAFAVLSLLAVAMVMEKRLAVLYVLLTLTTVANYVLHDPNIYTLLALSAPDAQLAAARWVNAAVNLLAFAVWTVWEAVLPGIGSPGEESSAGRSRGAATTL